MKILHVLRIHKIKWRHWVLLALFLLVTLTKMIPLWGFLYTTRIYPVIGKLLSLVSGIIPFAVGDIFIATSIAWVILFPIYEIGWRKRRRRVFWKSDRVSALGIRMVLYGLGIELFPAEYL